MPDTPVTYQVGQTATSKDGTKRMVFDGEKWVNDPSFKPTPPKAKTLAKDMDILKEASAKAQAERDTVRTYDQAEQAVKRLDTGPFQGMWMDAITPDNNGFWDGVGGFVGTPFRAFYSDQALEDRDQINTVNANAALAASANLKGAASDRDMALMRLTGLQTGKTKAENLRIIRDARLQSGLEQARAKYKARWISKYGSLSAPAPSGASFEEALQVGEQAYVKAYKARMAGKPLPRPKPKPKATKKPSRVPRKAPPRRRSTVTIDIHGNPVR